MYGSPHAAIRLKSLKPQDPGTDQLASLQWRVDDLVVVDAFSSDAIPTHLITREVVELYRSRLKPRGMMAFHVSSRFFDLAPVLARIAADLGLVGYLRNDRDTLPEKVEQAMRPSVWVVLARSQADFGQIAQAAGRWVRLDAAAGDPLWTDDHSNVLTAL